HHFKLFTEGIRPPAGEVYVPVESPRGELGFYIVSDGSGKPVRVHERAPTFANIQALPLMAEGGLVADLIAVIARTDPVMGPVDFKVEVCVQLPCALRGADRLLDDLATGLGIQPGETTPDGKIELHRTHECFGSCNRPPMCRVNDEYRENLTPEATQALIEEL